MYLYFYFKLVAPKRKRLIEAEAVLEKQMENLNEKRASLNAVMEKLMNLNDDYKAKINKKRVRYKIFYQIFIYNH